MMKVFRYSTIAAALVVPFFLLMGCAGASWSFSDILPGNGPKIVGTDVKIDDITEFYFTYDSSTNPPQFQRYRFSVKNGAYQFYHEKREGNHWPLREKDITVSGTKELSLEEWKTFFDYLKDGKWKRGKSILNPAEGGPGCFYTGKGTSPKSRSFPLQIMENRFPLKSFVLS